MIPPELMAAIIQNKADDLPRLIAADWLDEHGQSERAEFIRVQCEIAYWNGRPMPESGMTPERFRQLCERERELLELDTNYNDSTRNPHWWEWWPNDVHLAHYSHEYNTGGNGYRRGFLASVALTWQDWLTHADAILKATPLEKVRLTTQVPVERTTRPIFQHVTEIDWRLEGVPDSGTWRRSVSGREINNTNVDLIGLWTQEATQKLLSHRWPGIEFELPRNEPWGINYDHMNLRLIAMPFGIPEHILRGQ